MPATAQRYTAIAIVLHWAIAAAILYMLPLGFWMHEAVEHGVDGGYAAYQLHKSLGLTILALSLIRLGWRLTNSPPPLPAHMPAWEKVVAKATHWLFYVLIIAMPLSGWLFSSANWSLHDDQPLNVSTKWFGLFTIPSLFGLSSASNDVRSAAAQASGWTHLTLAWTMIGLAGLHVAAALKHQFIDRDETLAHMFPGLKAPNETAPPPKNPARLATLGAGLSLVAVALIALLITFVPYAKSPEGEEHAQAPSTFETVTTETTATTATATTEGVAVGEPNPAAPASAWRVDAAASSIGFGFTYDDGEQAPANFTGRFTRWRADIRFDPEHLDQSLANVTIEVASATDGVEIHDASLPTADWFDASAHPTATFRTSEIRHLDGDRYEARGTLTIKGRDREVRLPFTLTIAGDRATMNGRVSIDRHDFGVGNDTDGDQLISRNIGLSIRVVANRVP
ncbi:cytochrome b/b6 domain-containing protein [Terricaulis sp.]|uniref:cytochrome b/b6 domain-containing protein n=1 Tax=Terricaulis sp. TaxID=2768686 RepID=UPI0037847834